MYRCSLIKAESFLLSDTVCYQSHQHKSHIPKIHFGLESASFPRLLTNHSVLCFSCFLPPNTLVKMMMSDMNFYISPQLASHPCPTPLTFTIGLELTHGRQSLTSAFIPLLPPAHNHPPLPQDSDWQACCHQCHSQPPSLSMSLVSFPTEDWTSGQRNQESQNHHMQECNQHLSILENLCWIN